VNSKVSKLFVVYLLVHAAHHLQVHVLQFPEVPIACLGACINPFVTLKGRFSLNIGSLEALCAVHCGKLAMQVT
jgi:hypothetical protein